MSHLHYNKYAAYQDLSRYNEIHPGQNLTRSRTFTWQTCQRKPQLYSRFLLLRIYPESPVHTSANTEHIQICPVMLYIYPGKCIYTVI